MRLGLIARQDNRGLGIQAWELYRHLRPAVTVTVSMRELAEHADVKEYPERFLGAVPAVYRALKLEPYDRVRHALGMCDVVLMLETPYDWRLLTDLRDRGVKTVLVGNREFLENAHDPRLPRPDLFVAPSDWRLAEWPVNTVLLPHPVDRDRLPFRRREVARTFLHVAAPAMLDRAGTPRTVEAVRYLRADCRLVVKTQDARYLPRRLTHPLLSVDARDVDDYWTIYEGADVLVAPRRYGGQSLPLIEAMSLGMPVIALNREPDRRLVPAETLVAAQRVRSFPTNGGRIGVWDTHPRLIAAAMNRLAGDPFLVGKLSDDADRRAEAVSWRTLEPLWRQTLGGLLT